MAEGETLPGPLVPAHVDLRGYGYMALHGDRLLGSQTWLSATADAKVAALSLWWRAYAHEVPAGSLPNDDTLLAQYAGFGVALKAWFKVKPQALRGFFLCSDDRLHHRFLSEVVLAAWELRIEQNRRRENEAARKRRERDRRAAIFEQLRELGDVPAWNTKTSELEKLLVTRTDDDASAGQGEPVTGTRTDLSRLRSERKENEGTVPLKAAFPPSSEAARAALDSENPQPTSTQRGAMAKFLREHGVTITPSNPFLVAWIDRGVTIAQAHEGIAIARQRKPVPASIPPGYLDRIIGDIVNGKPAASAVSSPPKLRDDCQHRDAKGNVCGMPHAKPDPANGGERRCDHHVYCVPASNVIPDEFRSALKNITGSRP